MTSNRRADVLAEARIRCSGKLHRILLVGESEKPKLVLCDHRDKQGERVMETLSGKLCRCREVADAWRRVITAPGTSISRPGSAFRKTTVNYSELPGPFRKAARDARRKKVQRDRAHFEGPYAPVTYFTKNNGKPTFQQILEQLEGDREEAFLRFEQELGLRMKSTHDIIHETISALYFPQCVNSKITTFGAYALPRPGTPHINVLDKRHKYRNPTIHIYVELSDLIRAHLRTGCLARQPDGRRIAVVGISKNVWRRPCLGKPYSEAVLAWVVRQWRGQNWIMTQAILIREGDEWKVERWL